MTSFFSDIRKLAVAVSCEVGDSLDDYFWEENEFLTLLDECSHEGNIYDIDCHGDEDFFSNIEDDTVQDVSEELKISSFISATCKCSQLHGYPCSTLLKRDYIQRTRCEAMEADKDNQLDLMIMTYIRSATRNSSVAAKTPSANGQPRNVFSVDGIKVCLGTFLFLNAISKHRYYNINAHYRENGLTPRVHGNNKRLPYNTLRHEELLFFKSFMSNYAANHAVLLPGRYPGYKDLDIRLLPTGTTKNSVWEFYSTCCIESNMHVMSPSKFNSLWQELTPYIVISKPMTDLCWTCQKNTGLITRSTNTTETEKIAILEAHKEHLSAAKKERAFYQKSVESAKKQLSLFGNNVPVYTKRPPNSFAGEMHYSFDYAQQLHYPANPLQPGPMYFKVPRKCQLFGIVCEALPRQVNYLIDEAVSVGKGGDATVSLVHDFFPKFGLGEMIAWLHADNCSGQNKNRHFIFYLAWRVWQGLHKEINYSFMIAGHTKFLVDAHFGMVKKVTRSNFISSMFDIAECVENSSKNNIAEFVGDGNTEYVTRYAWGHWFDRFLRPVDHVKSYQHFRFCSDSPFIVYCKVSCDSPEIPFNLRKKKIPLPDKMELPPVLKPEGLSAARKDYLFNEIREFCKEGTKDLVAPKP